MTRHSLSALGISGGEFGVRGRLIAYDIKTGRRVWTAGLTRTALHR